MEQKSLQSVHYYRSYIEFYLCNAYVVNPVRLTPMAYSRLRDLQQSCRYSYKLYLKILYIKQFTE
jgi:hypothetical protein